MQLLLQTGLKIYFETLSSHFSITNMVPIEIQQAIMKTVQTIEIGIASYRMAPMKRSELPIAVAQSHKPCIIP